MSLSKFSTTTHTFPGQHIRHYAGATRRKDEDTQYLEAKQYKPLSNMEHRQGDISIIGVGAVSFPKEVYEPLWDDVLDHCESNGIRIRSIWAVDKSDHGASGILNEHTQGDDPSFSDLARDLLNMINTFREEMTVPIVGVGHSLGATALIELAAIHPRLFASLILIDPVIGHTSIKKAGMVLINASAHRPDLWSSRGEAEQAFKSTKAFRRWDPRVQKLWLEHGLRDTPTLLHPQPGMITLQTTKAIETWSYGRPWFDPLPSDGSLYTIQGRIKHPEADSTIHDTYPFYRPEPGLAWNILPRIRAGVLYVFPEGGPKTSPDRVRETIARTGSGVGGSGGEKMGRVDKALVKESAHLLPLEKPDNCARVITTWLARDLEIWKERKAFERDGQDDKSVDKVALSEEYVRRAEQWFEGNQKKVRSKL